MKTLGLKKLLYTISPYNEPAITIKAGETIAVETEDAFSGQIRKLGDKRDTVRMPYGNPQSGPVYVEGAEKGDTLVVGIEAIKPLIEQGATRVSGPSTLVGTTVARFLGTEFPGGTRICPIKGDKVYWSEKIVLPYEPMIGTIGTAPAIEAVSSGLVGAHGGNMDIREVCPGNKVYLPINVRGALLHLGDVHAVQGAGEFCGTAVEMPAESTLTIDVLKGKTISWPRIESPNYLMAVGVAKPMEAAVNIAYLELIGWLEEEYRDTLGLTKFELFNLLTQVGELSIGWYTQSAVAAKFPKRYLSTT